MRESIVLRYGKRSYYGLTRTFNHLKSFLTDPEPKLLILVYHRILPRVAFNPFSNVVSQAIFTSHLEEVAKRYRIVSLNDAVAQCRSGAPKTKMQAVLTFDDGYWDNYEFAFPLLKKMGLVATFFLATDYVGRDEPLWEWELIEILEGETRMSEVKVGDALIRKGALESNRSFALRVFDAMKSLDVPRRKDLLESLRAASKKRLGPDFARSGCITWEEAGYMARDGMEIGAHGVTHRSLARIPAAEAIEEIKKSKEAIERALQKPCLYFAFPFGSRSDYTQALITHVKDAGFQACVSNLHGYNHIERENFCFRRIIMEESTNPHFLLG
jgi:peptidoglycan/xylan/chitin deacetylase (PgdA/CDA1 family)